MMCRGRENKNFDIFIVVRQELAAQAESFFLVIYSVTGIAALWHYFWLAQLQFVIFFILDLDIQSGARSCNHIFACLRWDHLVTLIMDSVELVVKFQFPFGLQDLGEFKIDDGLK